MLPSLESTYLSRDEFFSRPILPALLVGRLPGAPSPSAARAILLAIHEWQLGERARLAAPRLLAPRPLQRTDLAKLFVSRDRVGALAAPPIFACAVRAAAPPATLTAGDERDQSALLRTIAAVLDVADPESEFVRTHGAPLAPMTHLEIRRALEARFAAPRRTPEEPLLVGTLSLPIDGVLEGPLPGGVSGAELAEGLSGTISLSLDERRRIVEVAPTLSSRGLRALVQIFAEERQKFGALGSKHRAQLRKLACRHAFDWLTLRAEALAESPAQTARSA
jgi:hypothetical protein